MSKVLFAISLMVLLSCGTGESGPGATGSTSDTPPVSAMAPSGDDAEGAGGEAIAVVEGDQADLKANRAAAQEAAAEAADAAADALGGTGN